MSDFSRRTFLLGATGAGLALAGCNTTAQQKPQVTAAAAPATPAAYGYGDAASSYASMYGPIPSEPFPLPPVDLRKINPAFLRQEVAYTRPDVPGTIVIDPQAHFLYHVRPGGRAMRYGVGVGREGFGWNGEATINSKQEWPDWYPPKEMIERQPELKDKLAQLRSGIGMQGGPSNPLGARAMYLWQGGKDTLYRIHGTVEPWTIGTSVSSGCIRMINQDVIDLYAATPVGTRVVVLA